MPSEPGCSLISFGFLFGIPFHHMPPSDSYLYSISHWDLLFFGCFGCGAWPKIMCSQIESRGLPHNKMINKLIRSDCLRRSLASFEANG